MYNGIITQIENRCYLWICKMLSNQNVQAETLVIPDIIKWSVGALNHLKPLQGLLVFIYSSP